MKRIMLIAVTLVMMCVANVAFAIVYEETMTGKITKMNKAPKGQEFAYEGTIATNDSGGYDFLLYKNATREFTQCIEMENIKA